MIDVTYLNNDEKEDDTETRKWDVLIILLYLYKITHRYPRDFE